MMPVASCAPFPFVASCDVMLTMLVCATCWLSMHLYMLAYMFMHESCLLVCRPYFNTMELWTFDSNLHLSLVDTTFCLPFRLFVFFLVCLFAFFLVCHILVSMLAMSIMFIYLMPLPRALCIFFFHCLTTGFLSFPLHVHTWSEGTVS